MKNLKYTLALGLLISAFSLFSAQTKTTDEGKAEAVKIDKSKLPKPYHPGENAGDKIAELVALAKKDGKNIILQAGGNWCIWCRKFEDFRLKNEQISEMLKENYHYYHLNFSPEDKNEKLFEKYGNPGEKFGYPVFIVLNTEGDVVHTQDSAVLEEGDGYSTEKVMDFLTKWASR